MKCREHLPVKSLTMSLYLLGLLIASASVGASQVPDVPKSIGETAQVAATGRQICHILCRIGP